MAQDVSGQAMERLKLLFYDYDDGTKKYIPIEGKMISNFNQIRDYLRMRQSEGLTHCTITCDIKALTHFCKIVDKPFSELTNSDIYELFDYLNSKSKATAKLHKAMVRGFLKYINREDLAQLCKVRKSQTDRKLPEDLLTPEEVELLIDNAVTLRDKALIAVLYETGAKIGELEEIQIKHVVFDEYGAIITLPKGKTGARTNRIVYSAGYLRQWLDIHPLKGDRNAWIWASTWDENKRVTYDTIRCMLKGVAKRAGIKKNVHPHLMRHSRATYLAKHLTEQQMKSELGWTAGSGMAAIYVHLSGKDRDEAILKMNGIEIKEKEQDNTLKTIKCPRCKETQDKRAVFCFKCGMPLTEEAFSVEEKVEADAISVVINDGYMSEFISNLKGLSPELIIALTNFMKNYTPSEK